MVFGENERNADGTDRTINYQEFINRVNQNIIDFRKDYKLKQKYLTSKEQGKNEANAEKAQ